MRIWSYGAMHSSTLSQVTYMHPTIVFVLVDCRWSCLSCPAAENVKTISRWSCCIVRDSRKQLSYIETWKVITSLSMAEIATSQTKEKTIEICWVPQGCHKVVLNRDSKKSPSYKHFLKLWSKESRLWKCIVYAA